MRALFDDCCTGIVVLVDAVPEAHELHAVFLILHLVDIVPDGPATANDLVEHPQDGLVRTAVKGTGERTDTRRHGGVEVRIR